MRPEVPAAEIMRWPSVPVLRVPILARSLHVAVALAALHVTFHTLRNSAAQAEYYPDWLLVGTRALLVVIALAVVMDIFRGWNGIIRLASLRAFVGTTIAVGAISVFTGRGLAAVAGMPWQMNMFTCASSVAVLAVGMRLGLIAIIVIWTEFFALHAQNSGALMALTEAGALLSLGVFCGALVHVIRRDVTRVDQAHRASMETQASEEALTSQQAAREWWDRFIHDTILAALLLASRDADSMRSRSASAALADDGLAALYGRQSSAQDRMADELLAVHARSLGLEPTGTVRDTGSSPGVRDEVIAAAEEAISNVAHHANTRTVAIDGELTADSVHLSVRDCGRGFNPSDPSDRLGIRNSLERRMLSVGGRAEVTSTPDIGTTVHLSWASEEEPSSVIWPERPYAVLGIPLFVFGALHAVAGLAVDHAANDVLLLTGAALVVLIVAVSIDQRVPDRWVMIGVGLLPVVTVVLTFNIDPMASPDFRTWYTGACVPVFAALALRGRRWFAFTVSLLTMTAFMVSGYVADTVAPVLAANVSAQQPLFCLAAVAISVSLERSAQHIAHMDRQQAAARASMTRSRAREHERQARLQLLADDVEPLLHHIAGNARLDDGDRKAARRAEAALRDRLTGGALLDDAVRTSVGAARDRGVTVTLTASDDAITLAEGVRATISDLLCRCADACGNGSALTVRLAQTPDYGRCTVAVVNPMEKPETPASHPAGVEVKQLRDADSLLVTIRWSDTSHQEGDASRPCETGSANSTGHLVEDG